MAGKKKLTKAQIYQGVSRMVQEDDFPNKYWVMRPSPGILDLLRQVNKDDPDIVHHVPIKALAADITAHCGSTCGISDEYHLTPRDADAAAEYWARTTYVVAAPKMFLWPGETGLAYARLPWAQECGETPTWDSMLARMTNAQSFNDLIGSLFIEESSLHNYGWIHGAGNDGKGCINRFLQKVFNRAYRAKQPPPRDAKFWTYGLIGARVVVFPDCNAQGFVAGGLFKSLTGGDPVDVEAKLQMPFTTTLNCKFIFFSNENPAISSERADLRRIIHCEFTEEGAFDPLFEEKLWAEGGRYISKCIAGYLARYPNHGPIDSDQSAIKDWISTIEEEYETFFEETFHIDATKVYRTEKSVSHLTKDQLALVIVLPREMQAKIKERFPGQKEQREFYSWLKRTHMIKKVTVRSKAGVELGAGGRDPKFWVGACLRERMYGRAGRLSSVPGRHDGTD